MGSNNELGHFADIMFHFPDNFFHKSVNEPFIQRIMRIALENPNWILGNADLHEPDYFCNGAPFEFTLASDKKKKNNFIQKFQSGSYMSDDVEKDIFYYISTALDSKSKKTYSVPCPHVCVLCVEDMTSWVLDEYGSVTHGITDWRRAEFFKQIRSQYLDTRVFRNVFIIFPDCSAKWWVWDVKTNFKASIQLSPSDIVRGDVPYAIEVNLYDEIQKACLSQ